MKAIGFVICLTFIAENPSLTAFSNLYSSRIRVLLDMARRNPSHPPPIFQAEGSVFRPIAGEHSNLDLHRRLSFVSLFIAVVELIAYCSDRVRFYN